MQTVTLSHVRRQGAVPAAMSCHEAVGVAEGVGGGPVLAGVGVVTFSLRLLVCYRPLAADLEPAFGAFLRDPGTALAQETFGADA